MSFVDTKAESIATVGTGDAQGDSTEPWCILPPFETVAINAKEVSKEAFVHFVDKEIRIALKNNELGKVVRIACEEDEVRFFAYSYVKKQLNKKNNGTIFGYVHSQKQFQEKVTDQCKIIFVLDKFVNFEKINKLDDIITLNDEGLENKLNIIRNKICEKTNRRYGENDNSKEHIEEIMEIIRDSIAEDLMAQSPVVYDDPEDGFKVRKRIYENAFRRKFGKKPRSGTNNAYTARDFLVENWGHFQGNIDYNPKYIKKHDPELYNRLLSLLACIKRGSGNREVPIDMSLSELVDDPTPSVRTSIVFTE